MATTTTTSSSSASATPCTFFVQGKCRKGAACTFYHAPREDLAKSPLPCKFFLQNACRAGRECKFSHVTGVEAHAAIKVSASTGETTLAPGSFRVPCKFFKHGECSVGDKCLYLHVKGSSSSGSQAEQRAKPKPAPSSTVKMHVLAPKSKASMEGDEFEEKAEAAAAATASNSADEQHLSDFLTKEEELFYYGAPGEFTESDAVASHAQPPAPSYSEISRKNAPVAIDDCFVEDFDEPTARPKTCTFFLQGLCRYGDSCFYMHSLREEVETEDDMIEMGRELQASADLECNICYDAILAKNERFGLLSGCNHAFCLTCVRNWRGTGDQPKQTVRQCPVCRVETHFVIPSSRMVTHPARKAALIKTYLQNLAAIPCHHFDEGRGTCPFGSSCFYAHRFPDGTLDTRRVRTAVDADGHYDVLRQMRLEHFFNRA